MQDQEINNGYPRTTGDMDVWIERTPENYTSLSKAFSALGMPMAANRPKDQNDLENL